MNASNNNNKAEQTMKANTTSYGLPVCDLLTAACDKVRAENLARVEPTSQWAILVERHYYGPETRYSLFRDWVFRGEVGGEVAHYSTRLEASAVMSKLSNGTYYLAHNESSRPRYRLVRVGSRNYKRGLDAWGM